MSEVFEGFVYGNAAKTRGVPSGYTLASPFALDARLVQGEWSDLFTVGASAYVGMPFYVHDADANGKPGYFIVTEIPDPATADWKTTAFTDKAGAEAFGFRFIEIVSPDLTVYKVKGTQGVSILANISVLNPDAGDVYNVDEEFYINQETGNITTAPDLANFTAGDFVHYSAYSNVVWVNNTSFENGGYWDALGGEFARFEPTDLNFTISSDFLNDSSGVSVDSNGTIHLDLSLKDVQINGNDSQALISGALSINSTVMNLSLEINQAELFTGTSTAEGSLISISWENAPSAFELSINDSYLYDSISSLSDSISTLSDELSTSVESLSTELSTTNESIVSIETNLTEYALKPTGGFSFEWTSDSMPASVSVDNDEQMWHLTLPFGGNGQATDDLSIVSLSIDLLPGSYSDPNQVSINLSVDSVALASFVEEQTTSIFASTSASDSDNGVSVTVGFTDSASISIDVSVDLDTLDAKPKWIWLCDSAQTTE